MYDSNSRVSRQTIQAIALKSKARMYLKQCKANVTVAILLLVCKCIRSSITECAVQRVALTSAKQSSFHSYKLYEQHAVNVRSMIKTGSKYFYDDLHKRIAAAQSKQDT